jgi:large subunit ribosomal protein L19
MSILQEVQEMAILPRPNIRTGNTVRVRQRIKEGKKERVQTFEGLVIKTNHGHGADSTFTVRKICSGGYGVEKIFPTYSPLIEVELVKIAKVRRAKLYYMRDRSGKSARLKERFATKEEGALQNVPEPVVEAPVEEPKAEETNAPVEAQAAVETAPAEAAAPTETAEATPETQEAPAEKVEQPEVKEEAKTEEAPAADEKPEEKAE